MRSIYKMIPLRGLILLAVTGGIFAACSVFDSGADDEVTGADLEMAAHIMGESMSGQNSGVISSIYDATADMGSDGMGYETSASKSTGSTASAVNDSSGRGGESGWSYSYNPENGIHTVEFFRNVTRGVFSKSIAATYKYLFKDPEGTFVQFPRVNPDSVETEDFFGIRTGSVQTPRRTSTFSRKDTLYFSGLGQESGTVFLQGNHAGQGEFSVTRVSDERVSRTYSVTAEFVDIEIEKAAILADDSLERGVTGTINYTVELTKTTGGQTRTVSIRGSIELNGDGSALLRFQNHQRLFIVNLIDGDIEES